VPALDEVFALLKERGHKETLVAIDLKIDDNKVEAEVVRLANKHGVLSRLVFIGTTIDSAEVRKRLKEADAKAPTAVLAQTADDLEKALAVKDADWAYLRFIPTAAQVKQTHKAGKKVFLVGNLVMPHKPDNWDKARLAGVDAMLMDYPLECRMHWRDKK
jgi:glycerophosphoryl diester phosphodiesterase